MKRIITSILVLSLTFISYSQEKDSIRREILFPFSGGAQFTTGDLSQLYGNFLDINTGVIFKSSKGFTTGFQVDYLFESELQDASLFENLANEYNQFIGTGGTPVSPRVKGRGFKMELSFGKIIPLTEKNRNSGIWIQSKIGYMQHKLHFSAGLETYPQLNDSYRKGYDRLAGGMNYSGFIGYLHMPPLIQHRIADIPTYSDIYGVFIGLELNRNYAYGQRSYQYDLQSTYTDLNIHNLFALKFGGIFTLNYRRRDGVQYY